MNPLAFGSRAAFVLLLLASAASAAERSLDTFKRQQLTDTYYSEGAGAGDINGDGKMDVVYGPYWYEGPDFTVKHEIYPPKPQNLKGYADHFFAWVYDFNGDKLGDIFVVGFPGTPAYVYENPGKGKWDSHWKKHTVFDIVSNESPHFCNIVGDERPELICTRGGFFGYATIDWDKPFEKWTWHPVSAKTAPVSFGHGLGVGDINGDGRADIIHANGWFEQPEKTDGDPLWTSQKAAFHGGAYGGAEMYAYDVDGDGDSDVITSLAAHDFGLAWYEQVKIDGKIDFKQHLIMGSKPEQNRYGLVFSEPHSVNLADIDGDGLKDIVTGKTYWSHHQGSPMWDAGAVTYWFKLVRGKDGVDWVPIKADGEAGIGRQLRVEDLNGDGLPDMVMGGMRGAHVLTHVREKVSEEKWNAAQPKVYVAPPPQEKPVVDGALEGETLKVLKASGGRTINQKMTPFTKGKWSGDDQLFWLGGKAGDKLDLELPVEADGEYEVSMVFTKARDYAIVQVHLDGKPLGKPIDLFNEPDVINSSVIRFGKQDLKAGKHTLTIEITGANEKADKAYMVGLDYVRLAK
jgi:hypothetical protein